MATRDLTWPPDPQPEDDSEDRRRDLPMLLEPLMLAHTALTGDVQQYQEWKSRIRDVKHQRDIEEAPDTESRSILKEVEAWAQMKATGRLGTAFGMGLGLLWTSHLIWYFGTYLGKGWPAALLMLLPLPFAWKVGTRLWERASLAGMRDIGRRATASRRLKALLKGVFRGFGAGFGFSFTLVLSQLLLSWFVNPAPTLAMEIASDTWWALWAGMMGGGFGILLSPLLAQGAPSVERAELEETSRSKLPAETDNGLDPDSM